MTEYEMGSYSQEDEGITTRVKKICAKGLPLAFEAVELKEKSLNPWTR